jgi:hypothetical protein
MMKKSSRSSQAQVQSLLDLLAGLQSGVSPSGTMASETQHYVGKMLARCELFCTWTNDGHTCLYGRQALDEHLRALQEKLSSPEGKAQARLGDLDIFYQYMWMLSGDDAARVREWSRLLCSSVDTIKASATQRKKSGQEKLGEGGSARAKVLKLFG